MKKGEGPNEGSKRGAEEPQLSERGDLKEERGGSSNLSSFPVRNMPLGEEVEHHRKFRQGRKKEQEGKNRSMIKITPAHQSSREKPKKKKNATLGKLSPGEKRDQLEKRSNRQGPGKGQEEGGTLQTGCPCLSASGRGKRNDSHTRRE